MLRLIVSSWFQVLFARRLGVLFTFPSRYWSTIGHGRVFSLTRWCWRVLTGFLRSRDTRGIPREPVALHLRDYHPLWCCFPVSFNFGAWLRIVGPTTLTQPKPRQFRLFPLRSSLLRESRLFSFPPATEIFQLAGLALSTYVFSAKWQAKPARFPHSEIHGSTFICNFPWLIAAYHALHRLSMPRHPP